MKNKYFIYQEKYNNKSYFKRIAANTLFDKAVGFTSHLEDCKLFDTEQSAYEQLILIKELLPNTQLFIDKTIQNEKSSS